jgi:copper transport protein
MTRLLRKLGRAAALLGALVVAMVANPGTASAHAALIATTPSSFQVLSAAPHEVSLRFSENVDVALAEVRLIGPGGAAVAGVSQPAHPAGQPDTVSATLPAKLANGTYTVTYRVTSADTHPVEGAFAFSVGEVTGGVVSGAEPAAASGAISVAYGIFRWVAYTGLALLLGTAFFVAVCRPDGEASSDTRRLLWAGWGTLLGGTLMTFVLYGPSAAGGSFGGVVDPALLGATLSSRIGLVLVVRLVLLGLLAAGLAYLPRITSSTRYAEAGHRRRGGLVLVVGVALAVTWSLANHSAAGTQVLLALPVDALHLLAMAVWLGGLPALIGALRARDVAVMRVAIPRFSRIALGCVLVLVVTGTYQAWREVGTPAALFGTTYGIVLGAKLALVVVLVALGAFARKWVQRHYAFDIVTVSDKRRARRGPERSEVSRFRRAVSVEVVVAAVVLGTTAVLVNAEPAAAELARTRELAAIPARVGPVNLVLPFDAGGAQGVGKLAVLVTPGAVGKNEVHLAVLDAAGKPKQVAELRGELRLPSRGIGPLPIDVQLVGGDHAIASNAPITMPGMWELDVTVRTSEIDQAVVRVPVGAR